MNVAALCTALFVGLAVLVGELASDPDTIFFIDYPGQSYEEKVTVLKANPASRNLDAVKQERFVNLPYSVWVSGPLNIDAAEWVRRAVEHFGLAPESGIETTLDLTKLSELPGNEWIEEVNASWRSASAGNSAAQSHQSTTVRIAISHGYTTVAT